MLIAQDIAPDLSSMNNQELADQIKERADRLNEAIAQARACDLVVEVDELFGDVTVSVSQVLATTTLAD